MTKSCSFTSKIFYLVPLYKNLQNPAIVPGILQFEWIIKNKPSCAEVKIIIHRLHDPTFLLTRQPITTCTLPTHLHESRALCTLCIFYPYELDFLRIDRSLLYCYHYHYCRVTFWSNQSFIKTLLSALLSSSAHSHFYYKLFFNSNSRCRKKWFVFNLFATPDNNMYRKDAWFVVLET